MISTKRAWITLDNIFSEISLGSLPLNPGIETISFSLFSPGQAEPNFTFKSSACFSMIEQPSFISSVITLPPKGITAVWRIIPSLKMATSVVPPPISTKHTPASFSSSLNTASADARGSSVIPETSKSDFFTQEKIFPMAAFCPTTIWRFASSRLPNIPIGSLIFGSPSILYSCGNTWMISSPGSITNLWTFSTSLSISAWVITSWASSRRI